MGLNPSRPYTGTKTKGVPWPQELAAPAAWMHHRADTTAVAIEKA